MTFRWFRSKPDPRDERPEAAHPDPKAGEGEPADANPGELERVEGGRGVVVNPNDLGYIGTRTGVGSFFRR